MKVDLSKLHVITMISNPVRYQSRYRLYWQFKEHLRSLGIHLWTAEVAYGHRHWHVVEDGDPRGLRLRTSDEVWHKENALNLLIQRLPSDWEYVCWVDADVSFMRPDVFTEAWHQLQHHPVVQLWSHAADLTPGGRTMKTAKSFAACYLDGAYSNPCKTDPYGYAHTGYAWGARREFFESVGGLLDFAPLGSADFYMAWALIQELTPHLDWRRKQGFTAAYIDMIASWQTNAAALKRDVGVVEGTIAHYWHGKKTQRGYNTRENILIRNKYDPRLDLKRDWQGLYKLTDRSPSLKYDIRIYMRSRNEDSIDLDTP